MGFPPAPVSPQNLCRYIAHLSLRLSANSIPKYLSVVGLLHKELGLPDPCQASWLVKSLVTGIKKVKGVAVARKLPITPRILGQIYSCLDFALPNDCNFWAICLTLFFGCFRKGNILRLASVFNPTIHVRRKDFHLWHWGISVVVRHSKTIQMCQRELSVPLLSIPGHQLCPVSAIVRAFALSVVADQHGPPFVLCDGIGFKGYGPELFVNKLRAILASLGYEPKAYSGHSFRRGAASWGLQAGMPSDLIQILGDWRSDAYRLYISLPVDSKVSLLRNYISKI